MYFSVPALACAYYATTIIPTVSAVRSVSQEALASIIETAATSDALKPTPASPASFAGALESQGLTNTNLGPSAMGPHPPADFPLEGFSNALSTSELNFPSKIFSNMRSLSLSSCEDDSEFVKRRGKRQRTCEYIKKTQWRRNKWCNKKKKGVLIRSICCETCQKCTTCKKSLELAESLYLRDRLGTSTGEFILQFETGGNLIIYKKTTSWESTWATNTSNGVVVFMQKDGNLVMRDVDNNPIWKSNTANKGCTAAKMLDTGKLVIVDAAGKIWAEFG
eukprot:CAMPEP_0194281524 /NCGR_PEP_ID=MMETSP0169-20130528/20868_1 /TAXON_ID=218684 /ORGANISM="Corethron pennatum, Strain L29A3" /LENGTH=277 /DNA_ID=CAMNT_0039026597 /DNA_START=38 /DNA_END=871 /DNA_ORIENTATION=-